MSTFTGQIVLVTGAGAGIGAAIAEELGLQGATVAINYIQNKTRAESVAANIKDSGGNAVAVQGDVESEASVEAMLKTIEQKLGPIDILVLCAAPPAFWSRIVDQPLDIFEKKLLAEMRSFMITGSLVGKAMEKRGKGCIIGLSSVMGRKPIEGFGVHSMVKSAIEAMLKTMALELAPAGIRVNTIAPSLTQTPGSSWVPDESIEQTIADTPLGRLCTPEDIAKAVAMIASDDLSFITGAYIPVNGGLQLG
jgi:3-oxoacyl-[acyl-carrier protein] reductase